jgi:hypothetical protein
MQISDLILELHSLAREIKDPELAFKTKCFANELAILGNQIHESENKE